MSSSCGTEPLLEALEISKVFFRPTGPLKVLDGLDFVLQQEQAVAVMGASGSGKSTLLNILGSLDHPSTGHFRYRGEVLDFGKRSVVDHWRSRRIGFVFQNHMLLPDFTAFENLLLPARRLGPITHEIRQRAEYFLETTGLIDRAAHLPGELSGGEQQRIAVARAFMNTPAIVLADEPFGNLDREIGGRLGEMLFGLRDSEGTSLVIVTHDPRLAAIADLVLELVDGKLNPVESESLR